MTSGTRTIEFDLTKTFTLLFCMIGIHSFYDLTTIDMADSAIGSVLNVLAGSCGAPIFMTCMGITLSFSRHNSPKDYLSRGIQLLTLGMAVNVLRWGSQAFRAYMTNDVELYKGLALIFNVDIMQFAGLAFMLLALLLVLHIRPWQMLLLGVALNIIGSTLEGHYTDSYVVNQILGYFYPTPTCCCFPLLNWFIFVATGNMLGYLYHTLDDISRFYRIAIPVCGVITAVYMYLTIVTQLPFLRTLQGDWGLYWINPYDAFFIAFGVAPFEIGVFWLLGKVIPHRWMRVLAYPSMHINQFFCISWVLIMWTANIFLFVPKATTNGEFVIIWCSIVALTILISWVYNSYLRERIAPVFSRHSLAWSIGVWAFLIAFGVWYFTTIPGPYMMPY